MNVTLQLEEFVDIQSCLFDDRTDSSFRQRSWVVGNGGPSAAGRISPNLVTSLRVTVKLKAGGT